jgi:hypothetical protein
MGLTSRSLAFASGYKRGKIMAELDYTQYPTQSPQSGSHSRFYLKVSLGSEDYFNPIHHENFISICNIDLHSLSCHSKVIA